MGAWEASKGEEREEEEERTEVKANETGKSAAGGKEIDSTDNNTNEHINTINRGAGGKNMEEDEAQDPASSPKRKKVRKEKKKKKNK